MKYSEYKMITDKASVIEIIDIYEGVKYVSITDGVVIDTERNQYKIIGNQITQCNKEVIFTVVCENCGEEYSHMIDECKSCDSDTFIRKEIRA